MISSEIKWQKNCRISTQWLKKNCPFWKILQQYFSKKLRNSPKLIFENESLELIHCTFAMTVQFSSEVVTKQISKWVKGGFMYIYSDYERLTKKTDLPLTFQMNPAAKIVSTRIFSDCRSNRAWFITGNFFETVHQSQKLLNNFHAWFANEVLYLSQN